MACPVRQLSWSLQGTEVAIWDLLTLGYSFDQLARVLALIEDVTDESAVQQVRATLHAWHQAGILQVRGASEYGEPDD